MIPIWWILSLQKSVDLYLRLLTQKWMSLLKQHYEKYLMGVACIRRMGYLASAEGEKCPTDLLIVAEPQDNNMWLCQFVTEVRNKMEALIP